MKNEQSLWWIYMLIVSTFSLSCEEVVDWELLPEKPDQLVIDAVLTNQFIKQQVILSESFPDLQSDPNPVVDAEVILWRGEEQLLFRHVVDEPGLYQSAEPFSIVKDYVYRIEVSWNGITYEASTELSFVTPIARPQFQRRGNSDSLSLSEVGAIYHPLEQAMYQFDISWPEQPGWPAGRSHQFFYTFSTLDANQIFVPTREEVFFPKGSEVHITKFGLSEDFASYLRGIALETQWQGGLFDAQSSNPQGNFNPEAWGYFALCAVLSDTVIAE